MEERETFRRLLHDAAEAELAPGAAERIADRAWERAAELRRDAGGAGRFRPRLLPLAAAAAVLAAAVIALRGTEPAFAVDGDAVQVRCGDEWKTSRKVPVGSWVFSPKGTKSSVRGTDGSLVRPRPGALFRIVAAAPRPAWRVELRSGDAEVSGGAISLRIADSLEVARSGEHDVLRVVASLGAALDDAPVQIDATDVPAARTPWVRSLDGTVRVADLCGPDVMLLRPAEVAVRLTFATDGRSVSRLARETSWSPDTPAHVLLGERVVAAYPRFSGGFSIALESSDARLRSVSVAPEFRTEAIAQLGLVAAAQAQIQACAFQVVPPERVGGPDAPVVQIGWTADLTPPSPVCAEYTHESDRRTTRIVVRVDGTARFERTGADPREFATLAALREAEPAAAALFGDRLR
jgi:hypothetical protein